MSVDLRHLDAWRTTEPDPHRECRGFCPDCGSCFDCSPCVCPLYADEEEEMTEQEIADGRREIDALSREEMARLWRFAPVGHPYFMGVLGDYFAARFKALGGMTPKISKKVGW